MKKNIHPNYTEVAFKDVSTGETFITRSTAVSDLTINIDNNIYPLIVADVTNLSHPFWTNSQRNIDNEGRVALFNRRYNKV